MDMFQVEIISLNPGDQFRLKDEFYGYKNFEVFSTDHSSVKVFPIDVPLFREDQTYIRNMIFNYRRGSEKLMVEPIVNKMVVINRNHEEIGHPETYLFKNV